LLNQAAPVQNTWYPVLVATEGVMIYYMSALVTVVNETIELRLTIDGNARVGSLAAIFGTEYWFYLHPSYAGANSLKSSVGVINAGYYCTVKGQSITVEIRKTTAAGAGNLQSKVTWARLLPT
jgi:hypothetical protein